MMKVFIRNMFNNILLLVVNMKISHFFLFFILFFEEWVIFFPIRCAEPIVAIRGGHEWQGEWVAW